MRSIARYGGLMVAAALALAGCARAQAAGAGTDPAPESLAGTSWRLVQLESRAPIAVPGGGVPTLAFASGEPRVSGNGGCNLFNGSYTLSGGSLRFGPLASTRRACLSEEANHQETAYLRALQSTTRFSVTGDQLDLYAGDLVVVSLRRSGG